MAASRVKEAAPFDDPRQAGWPCFGAQSEGEGRSRPGFGCRPGCGAACDDDHALDPAVRGLPSRSKGFTTTTRRALRAAGVTYFTTLLCATTTLLNSIQAAEFWEINGISPQGPFWLYFGRDGHHLPGLRQRLWVQPEEGDCGTLREDAGLCVDRAYVRGALLQEAPLLCSGGTTFEPNGDARTLPGNWRREPVLRWREAVTSPGNGLWT